MCDKESLAGGAGVGKMVEIIKDLDGVRNRKGSVRTSSPSTNRTPLFFISLRKLLQMLRRKDWSLYLGRSFVS